MRPDQEKAWSIVICEGYHDRAFWKGMLLHGLGCTDPSDAGKRNVYDPWDEMVTRGRFGFLDDQKRLIVVVPSHGDTKVGRTAEEFLQKRQDKPLRRLVLNVDDDAAVGAASNAPSRRATFIDLIKKHEPNLKELQNGDIELRDGCIVSIVVWSSMGAPQQDGVPSHENLERLVCSALAAVDPARAGHVSSFLASAGHTAARAEAKAHAWSYMAHRWPEDGCERFFEHLWAGEEIRGQLIPLLGDGWRVAQDLVK